MKSAVAACRVGRVGPGSRCAGPRAHRRRAPARLAHRGSDCWPGLRPTSDRVRETLFNWLAPVLPGARCLDLFAGSGALGFEAVARGGARW
jgi:hypothetical protein